MNWFGVSVGVANLFGIGLGFIRVIRGERYFGYLWWPYVLGFGILGVVGSLFVPNDWNSVLLGAIGASLIWDSTELKEQAVRGELGWYPFREKKILPPFAGIRNVEGAEIMKSRVWCEVYLLSGKNMSDHSLPKL